MSNVKWNEVECNVIADGELALISGGQPAGHPLGQWAARLGQKMGKGEFDYNRAVDNGNRYGAAGIIAGGAAGWLAGNPVTSAGGAVLGGALGWVGGAAYDANKQLEGK
jgi:hypothetical protein